jgi:hypothetical protein
LYTGEGKKKEVPKKKAGEKVVRNRSHAPKLRGASETEDKKQKIVAKCFRLFQ